MNEFLNSAEGKRILKFTSIALGVFIAFLALEAASVVKDLNYPNPATSNISVTGTGDATSVPDIATFTFSVSADAKDVASAQQTVTTKTNDILAGLKDLGIADKDVKTESYNVYPKYVYQNSVCPATGVCPPSRQIPDGYTVTESISVKVRKTDDAGKALSLAGEKGATNISGLSFTLDDPQAPMNEAREKAIDNAKEKAELLAKRLGVRLVRVVAYYDNTPQGPVYYDKAAYGMGGAGGVAPAPASVPTGENKVTANVTVTYEIR